MSNVPDISDILQYSLISLIGVYIGKKPLKQHFDELRKKWSEYNNWRKGTYDSKAVVSQLESSVQLNPVDALHKMAMRAAAAYGAALSNDDISSYYSTALNHALFVFENMNANMTPLEAELAALDKSTAGSPDKSHIIRSLDEFIEARYRFIPYERRSKAA